LEERVIPVFDLTPFVSLLDWTVAIERFLQTGNAEMVSKLGIEELKPLLAKTKGEVGGELRKLISLLKSFSEKVSTCRASDFKSTLEEISGVIPKAEKELEELKPFKPLFGKIKEFFNVSIKNDIHSGLEVSSWCLEKGLVQQGYTILRETIVNYVILEVLGSEYLKKKNNRAIAESMLNNEYEKIPRDILKLWGEIVDYRNDINHAGWREQNYHTPKDFEEKLREFIERGRSLLIDGNKFQ